MKKVPFRWVAALAITGGLAFATPTNAEDANWLFLSSVGEGTSRLTLRLDLNSAKVQPNGVTTYRWKSVMVNPFTFREMDIEMSAGLDCKTREDVELTTGKRTLLTREQLTDPNNKSPGVVAFRNFCSQVVAAPAKPQMKTKTVSP
jgi:hypothetical protein